MAMRRAALVRLHYTPMGGLAILLVCQLGSLGAAVRGEPWRDGVSQAKRSSAHFGSSLLRPKNATIIEEIATHNATGGGDSSGPEGLHVVQADPNGQLSDRLDMRNRTSAVSPRSQSDDTRRPSFVQTFKKHTSSLDSVAPPPYDTPECPYPDIKGKLFVAWVAGVMSTIAALGVALLCALAVAATPDEDDEMAPMRSTAANVPFMRRAKDGLMQLLTPSSEEVTPEEARKKAIQEAMEEQRRWASEEEPTEDVKKTKSRVTFVGFEEDQKAEMAEAIMAESGDERQGSEGSRSS